MGNHIHRLSNIDSIGKRAICSYCGDVGIYKSPSMSNWVCRQARKDQKHKYRKEHPEKSRGGDPVRKTQRHLERDKEIRLEVITHYGGKCAFCGNSNPRHLVFDHINNDGAVDRKNVGYNLTARWIKSHGFPDNLQLLCYNHNAEKQYYHTMSL